MSVIKGIVLDVKDEYVIIATTDGHFIKTEYTGSPPSIGIEIEVNEIPKIFPWKKSLQLQPLLYLLLHHYFTCFCTRRLTWQ